MLCISILGSVEAIWDGNGTAGLSLDSGLSTLDSGLWTLDGHEKCGEGSGEVGRDGTGSIRRIQETTRRGETRT